MFKKSLWRFPQYEKTMIDETQRKFPNLHIFLCTFGSNKNWQARRQILTGCSIHFIEASNEDWNSLIFTRSERMLWVYHVWKLPHYVVTIRYLHFQNIEASNFFVHFEQIEKYHYGALYLHNPDTNGVL